MTNFAYPGNVSLPAEVKSRVLTTFRQALDLYKQGRTNDVVSGCELIAKMDPQFDPAKKLLQKARNPAAEVDLDALIGSIGVADPTLAEANAALASRDFERAEQLADAALSNDLTNIEAQKIAQAARERIEAQPFVQQFLEKARQQRAAGQEIAAATTIEKARALDPLNPQLKEFERGGVPAGFDFAAESSPFGSAFTPPASAPPADASSPFDSFVVEPPTETPAAPPSGSPASDFGFTFEEEQKPAEPFSAGAAAATPDLEGPASAGEFDFSTASVEVTAEDQTKIAKYLEEGDQTFDRGDFQKAIDLWSRIFLIDVTNDEASARIEKARAKRIEIDRKVEELVAQGTRSAERGENAGAKAKFEEALQLDPTNFDASEGLERLASGALPLAAAAGPATAAAASKPGQDIFADDFSGAQQGETLVPPAPTSTRPRAAAVAAIPGVARKAPSKVMLFGAIGIAVLVLAAAGWFGFSKLGGGDDYDAGRTEATFSESQALAGRGEFDKAITMLSSITRQDPQYDRALSMIADLQRKKTQAAAQRRPPMEIYNEQVARGQAAYAAQDFVTAKQAFEQAAAVQPLPPDLKAQFDAAAQQVARTQSAALLFKEGKYREALASLEAMLAQDPQNANIRLMISHAHFNLGQLALQEEKTEEAMAHFDQVLAANPSDELARRSRDLAARYNKERKDLLYRIFVKYLPLRGLS
jgi:tetratricopeptide (TPR) repeat protein